MISQKIPSFKRLCAESELSYTVRFSEYKAHSPERGRSSYGSRPPCFRFTERFHSHLAFAPCSCRAMWMFALLHLCVQARTAHYAASTLIIYERCHSHSAVAACSCRAMWMFALLRLCVQARTAQYAASTLFIYERCHSHSAVAACSCRAMWMFALLRLCVQARTAHYATSTHRS